MKIAFFITSKGHGLGGHFYSLRATAEALAKQFDTEIINIGLFPSDVLCDLANWRFFPVQKPLLKTLFPLRRYIIHSKPAVFHAFDLESLLFCRFLSLMTNIPVLFTKCGGPNPTRYFPAVKDTIVYSSENLAFFEKSAWHRHTKFHLISNRIKSVEQDPVRIEKLRRKLRQGSTIIMRISRLGNYYKSSILSSVGLVKRLAQDGHNVQLLLVGAVQDKSFANELQNHAGKDILIETGDEYTRNASMLIDVADFVIGTGRGAMEAALLGKVLLAPVAGADIPILVNSENIENFVAYNFSERTQLPETLEESQYNLIASFVENKQLRKEYSNFITTFAERNFDINTRLEDYVRLYQCLPKHFTTHPLDLLIHTEYVRRSFCQARKAAEQQGKSFA